MPSDPRAESSDANPHLKSIGEHIAERPDPILNYTIVALVGMLAGFIIGCLFSHGSFATSSTPTYPPVPHPRALESPAQPTR